MNEIITVRHSKARMVGARLAVWAQPNAAWGPCVRLMPMRDAAIPTPTQVTLESSPESAGVHVGAGASAMAACARARRRPLLMLSRRRN